MQHVLFCLNAKKSTNRPQILLSCPCYWGYSSSVCIRGKSSAVEGYTEVRECHSKCKKTKLEFWDSSMSPTFSILMLLLDRELRLARQLTWRGKGCWSHGAHGSFWVTGGFLLYREHMENVRIYQDHGAAIIPSHFWYLPVEHSFFTLFRTSAAVCAAAIPKWFVFTLSPHFWAMTLFFHLPFPFLVLNCEMYKLDTFWESTSFLLSLSLSLYCNICFSIFAPWT